MFYVSSAPAAGDDFARGTRAAPFRTIERAQLAARSSCMGRRARAAGTSNATEDACATVVLLPGTHRLSRPIYLDEADSGLWLRGSGGGAQAETIVSAGSL
eukprot:SAG11_NODE_3832_length_2198_cov_1.252978_2_plen_101_part_00